MSLTVCFSGCTIGGTGHHAAELSQETMVRFWKVYTHCLCYHEADVLIPHLKIFLANQFTYFVVCPVIKISIICFYRRVFTIPTFQHVSFGLNCLIGTWGTAIFIACALQCRPLKAYWDKSINGQCFDSQLFIVVNQVFNVTMDFIILALPVPMIWNLQRSWHDKLALNGVFAVGGFVCFASIYRIVVLFWMNPADVTWTIHEAVLWTHVEPSIGLICSCLPVIRGLFPQFKLTPNRSKNGTGPYYINTDISKSALSRLTMSSPKSPASDYVMMEDGLATRTQHDKGSPKLDYSSNHLGPMDITVRTSIDVIQDNASAKSRG